MFRSFVIVNPNIDHLRNRTKLSSFEFIQEMIELIRTLNEPGFLRFYTQLDFCHNFVFEQCVDQNISVSAIQSILDSHNFDIRIILQFLVNRQYFIFFGSKSASNQITKTEGNKLRNLFQNFALLLFGFIS